MAFRPIKYYHLPCQRRLPPLFCFYDDTHFCFCNDYDHQRIANCFGLSNCENNAQCFQDRVTCPQRSVRVCPKCFYGVRCQFSTNSFSLSLDAILGYHIHPNFLISRQPRIVISIRDDHCVNWSYQWCLIGDCIQE